jgi:hypothetical protein
MTALLIWLLVAWPAPGFNARWVDMPPSINLETYRAARKAAARPSFCKWNGPDTPCRVS